jgi:hypothetical protein
VDCDIDEIDLLELDADKLEFLGGTTTSKYSHPRVKIGTLLIDGVNFADKGFILYGLVREAVVNNAVSDRGKKGGVNITITNRSAGLLRFTSDNCEMDFLAVNGWSIGDVDIKGFRGVGKLYFMKGRYKSISIEDSQLEHVWADKSTIKNLTLKHVSTRSFAAMDAEIDRMVLDRVAFGNWFLDFENLQVNRFLVRDVTFESKKFLRLQGSNIDFEMGKRYWHIYQ